MAKVYPIDRGIIDRTQAFLMRKMDKDGTWSNIGATHGETIASMGNPKLLLTSYVTWSLLDSGYDRKQLKKSIEFIRDSVKQGEDNAYILALAANALAAYDAKDDSTLQALQKLDKLRQEVPEWKAIDFPAKGMSLTYAHGDGVTVETTALAALAMLKTGQFNDSVNQALTYLVKSKQGNGTWGSTQATILALKALLAGMGGSDLKDDIHFTIKVDGQEAARGKVDEDNADVMQSFDLKGLAKPGAHQVEIAVERRDEPDVSDRRPALRAVEEGQAPRKAAPSTSSVSYDRTKLSTNDLLHAKATLKYNGKIPTYMVMLDLGIAPGFNVDPGDFAEMVGKNKIKKFEITARQVIFCIIFGPPILNNPPTRKAQLLHTAGPKDCHRPRTGHQALVWGCPVHAIAGRRRNLYRFPPTIWRGTRGRVIRNLHSARNVVLATTSSPCSPYMVMRVDAAESSIRQPRPELDPASLCSNPDNTRVCPWPVSTTCQQFGSLPHQ